MKKLKITFKSNGEEIEKTAVVNDKLNSLMTLFDENEASQIIPDDFAQDGFWSLIFNEGNGLEYEVEFKYDKERTLEPIRAITWKHYVFNGESSAKVEVMY